MCFLRGLLILKFLFLFGFGIWGVAVSVCFLFLDTAVQMDGIETVLVELAILGFLS